MEYAFNIHLSHVKFINITLVHNICQMLGRYMKKMTLHSQTPETVNHNDANCRFSTAWLLHISPFGYIITIHLTQPRNFFFLRPILKIVFGLIIFYWLITFYYLTIFDFRLLYLFWLCTYSRNYLVVMNHKINTQFYNTYLHNYNSSTYQKIQPAAVCLI